MRSNKTKAQCQSLHFIKRYFERVGSELSKQNYKILCSYIRQGKPSYPDETLIKTLDKQSNRLFVKSIIAPWLFEGEIITIWDKQRNRLITVLPEKVETAKDIQWEKYYDQVDMIEFEDDNGSNN